VSLKNGKYGCRPANVWRVLVLLGASCRCMAFPLYELDPFGTLQVALDSRIGLEEWEKGCELRPRAETLSRREAAQMALCRNPQLQGSIQAMKVQAARYGQTIAVNFPSLSLQSSHNTRNTADVSSAVPGHAERIRKTGLYVSMPVFSSGASLSATDSAARTLRAAAMDVQEQVDNVLVNTLLAYYDVYLAQELIVVYENGRSIAQKSVEISTKRATGGIGSYSEVLQAEALLARAEIDLRRAREDLIAKRVALAALMSVPPAELSGGYISKKEIAFSGVSVPPGSEIDAADLINARPVYAAAQFRHEASTFRVEQTKREGLPSVALTAGVANQRAINRGVLMEDGPEKTLGVTLTIPIFDGFGRTYKVRESSAAKEVARQDMLAVKDRVAGEIVQNQLSYRQESDLAQYADAYLKASRASHEASLQRYRKGLAEIIEVLNAQRELTNADAEHLRSSIRLIEARVKVNRDHGRLTAEFE